MRPAHDSGRRISAAAGPDRQRTPYPAPSGSTAGCARRRTRCRSPDRPSPMSHPDRYDRSLEQSRNWRFVVPEVERHRYPEVEVRPRPRVTDQALRQLCGQELLAIDRATVGDRGVHPGQAARRHDTVGRRNLAVEERNIPLDKRFDPSAGGRPGCSPSVFSGRATSSRTKSRIPIPVTARASPDRIQP